MVAYVRAKNATAAGYLNWYRYVKCVSVLGNYRIFSNLIRTLFTVSEG